MSLHLSFAAATSTPLPRLDRLVFGVRGRQRDTGTTISSLRSDLAACSEVELVSRGGDRSNVQFKLFHLSDVSNNRLGHSLIDLHFAQSGGYLSIINRSSIQINPNTIMNGMLSDEGVECPIGLDGRHNVLGAAAAAAALTMDVPGQTELVGQIMQYNADALKALLPRGFDDSVTWLKSAELCVDLPLPDALSAVRTLQRSALVGATASDRDVYRSCASDGEDGPVVRWYRDLSGACSKAYAKLPDELRLEKSYTSRKAMMRLLNSGQLPLSGDNAARLVQEFAEAASPPLLSLVQHVREVLADDISPAAVATALCPLVSMAAGLKSGRGPAPSAQSVEHARTMLDAFLTCGMASAPGVAKGVAVRRVLEALVANGTLVTHGRKALYYLRHDIIPGAKSHLSV